MTLNEEDILTGDLISINDLRDKYYEGTLLSKEEYLALKNYDLHRIAHLNAAVNDMDFNKRYFELQVKANLSSFLEFVNL